MLEQVISRLVILVALLFPVGLHAQDPGDAVCPRPAPGAMVQAPPELHSRDGLLETTLHLRSAFDRHHLQRFCYVTGEGLISPTLRVHPGDTLLIHFRNELRTDIAQQTGIPQAEHPQASMPMPPTRQGTGALMSIPGQALPSRTDPADAPCFATGMSARGSNLHFHGMGLPPLCHQDDVLHTLVLSGQSFDYRVHVPLTESPGLYWYHPHGHGYTEAQVLGGASGAIIVEAPSASELPERTLLLRDSLVTEGTAEAHKADPNLPTWNMSLNFVPVNYPDDFPAVLDVPAKTRELWRVVNAAADLTYDLEYLVAGKPQPFLLQALDGVALPQVRSVAHLLLPPGARADAAVTMPVAGAHAELRTRKVDTGPDGENEPARRLAIIHGEPTQDGDRVPAMSGALDRNRTGAQPTAAVISTAAAPRPLVISTEAKRSGEASVSAPPPLSPGAALHTPVYQRTLYFSEHAVDPTNKEGYVQFFLTLEGEQPKQYVMGQPPDITVHQGSVERWTIENRARELHVFHIHQMHFRVVALDGMPTHDDALHDTVPVPYWTGTGPYPSVTLELDFRSRALIGEFVYHCHILGHEDAGMMGGIEVLPHGSPTSLAVRREAAGWIATARSTALREPPVGTVQFQLRGRVLAEIPLHDGVARLPDSVSLSALDVLYAGDRFNDPAHASAVRLANQPVR